MFSKIAIARISSAAPFAILLHSVIFCFARGHIWDVRGCRADTVILYFSIVDWDLVVIVRRWRVVISSLNRLNIFSVLFCS